jgi:hypothetical protein
MRAFNPALAVREFEDDLDRLLDDFLVEIAKALPDRYVEMPFGDEGVRRIGNAIAIADAEVEDGLEERLDAIVIDFSWGLTRLLRALREAVR